MRLILVVAFLIASLNSMSQEGKVRLKHNENHGYFKKYEKGVLIKEGMMVHGTPWGTWKQYDSKGKLMHVHTFE